MRRTNRWIRGMALALAAVMLAGLMGCAKTPAKETGSSGSQAQTSHSGNDSSDGSQADDGNSQDAGEAQNSNTSGNNGGSNSSGKQTGSVANKPGTTTKKPGTTTKKPATATTTKGDVNTIKTEIAFYQKIIDSECAWLASFQSSNGALPMTPAPDSKVKVSPYFSDFAALALLDGDKKYLANVKKYMDWHFNHLNTAATDYNGVDGTIYDYNITSSGGKVTKEEILVDANGKKSYDSTDSYAATFLSVLWKYYQKSGDKSYIESHYKEIARILNALYSTLSDGLTFAKPDYKVQYFMDNCEVYEGLVAAEKIYTNILVKKYSATSTNLAKVTKTKKLIFDTIESDLWNAGANRYDSYAGQGGNFSWNTFYADATCQGFAVNCGVISPTSSRAKHLYDKFNEYYSTGESKHSWEQISIPDSFYWGSLAYTGALMGDSSRVRTYMGRYQIIMKRHAYPLYNADCGKVVMAARVMVDRLNAQL